MAERSYDYAAELLDGTQYQQGGTFETPTGRAPTSIAVRNAPQPGITESLGAGTIDDPDSLLVYLAKRRFPDDDINESVARYGFVNGQPAYRADDGAMVMEYGDFGVDEVARFVGRAAGPTVGGTIGGAVGGPIGAAVGAAAGEGYRKVVANLLGEEQDPVENAADVAVEGLLGGLGWKVGELFGSKIVNRRLVRDAKQYDAKAAKQLVDTARNEFGIELTPAEATDLGSLINQQIKLGMGMDEAGDVIKGFLKRRADQVDDAIAKFTGRTQPGAVVGANIRDVSKQAIKDAYAAREAAVKAGYRMLDKANPMVPEREFMRLESDDLIREYIDKVTGTPKYGAIDEARNSYRVIDRAGKLMQDDLKRLAGDGLGPDSYEATLLRSAREKLLGVFDDTIPGYRDIRRTFANQSGPVEEIEAALEGVLSKTKDTSLWKSARNLLSGNSVDPADVKRIRTQFVTQGKEKEWDDVVNQYLSDVWETMRDTQGGANVMQGANFRKAVYGSKRQRETMQAVMGPERFESFRRLMNVLEATGRAPGRQSMTQPAQEFARQTELEVAPVATTLSELDVTQPLKAVQRWWVDRKVSGWSADLAKVMTSPGALEELEKLRKLRGLSPSSEKAISIVATALTRAGVLGAANVVAPTPSKPVPLTSPQ